MTHRRAVVILSACTFVWGASFTLNKLVLNHASPLLFMAIRFSVSALLLSAVYPKTSRSDWRVGLPLGALFALQLALFVVGLARITPARSAFLFSFQTPLVPIVVLVGHRHAPTRRGLVAVTLATIGTWWLTRPTGSGAGFGLGDVATIGSAVCAALYVVLAGYLSPRHEPIRLLAVQIVAMALLAATAAVVLERPRIEWNVTTMTLIPFLALSSVATFGGQLVGQRLVRATEAAVIYALEPLVAALISFVSLGETLTAAQWLGGGLILTGSVVAGIRKGPAEVRSKPPTGVGVS
jgi:drug/metabolite transporter (DMT)-like permease